MSRKAKRERARAAREVNLQNQQYELASQKKQEKKPPLTPRNEAQKPYLEALTTKEMIIAVGPAGAGKTYLPTALATDMLLAGDIERIVLCRPAVEPEGEKHGFLPGSMFEKLEPWMLPFLDVIEERAGKQRLMTWLKDGKIEIAPFTHMRGRTFKKAFIILDEAQNTTYGQMKLFLTRLGESIKVVINGDITQKDIKGPDGLSAAIRLAERHGVDAPVIRFTKKDIVRSTLCQQWVEAFENDREAA